MTAVMWRIKPMRGRAFYWRAFQEVVARTKGPRFVDDVMDAAIRFGNCLNVAHLTRCPWIAENPKAFATIQVNIDNGCMEDVAAMLLASVPRPLPFCVERMELADSLDWPPEMDWLVQIRDAADFLMFWSAFPVAIETTMEPAGAR